MSYFSISNLAHQLGSNELTISNLKKSHPHWDIKSVLDKTGIKKLYLSSENEDVLNLSIKSCKKTLKNFNKKKIDCVIVVTQTAKKKLPSVSCMIQDQLNLKKNIIAFDIGLGCSGFVYGLSIINSLISSNTVKTVLLICADTYNKFLDDQNRTCKTIFSDAASSCIIQKIDSNKKVKFSFLTDGSGATDLMENNNNIEMKGSNIFHFTTKNIPILFNEILKKNNLNKKNIDYFIFHQASELILNTITKKLKIPQEKFNRIYKNRGNSGGSTVGIALHEAIETGKIKQNSKVLLSAFGVGLSWCHAIYNFKEYLPYSYKID